MTPAELAARIAAERDWWTRWADANPTAARMYQRAARAEGWTPRHVDPLLNVRASDLEQILADARTLAAVASTVDDLTDDEAAAIARHQEGQ